MASLVVAGPGRQISLDAHSAASIGRDASCTLQVSDDRVSRRHGLVRFEHGVWIYEDLASSNGSFVDGVRVERLRISKTARVRLSNPVDGPTIYFEVGAEPSIRSQTVLAAAIGVVVVGALLFANAGGLSRVPASSPTPSAAASNAPTRTDIVASGKAATVLILQTNGQGSGVYLGNDRVLTALHVVSTNGPITISLNDRSIGTAQVIATDAQDDLAMLFAPGLGAAGAKAISWGESDKLREGDELVVLGYPIGLPFSVKVGVVSGLRTEGGIKLIQTDASLNPGMSGGPALDPSGSLVGITDFGYRNYPGLNFLVASATAKQFADDHR